MFWEPVGGVNCPNFYDFFHIRPPPPLGKK
nr:MAG TPA: hypothetical protein [Caudoviricetes sp.]